MKITKRFTILAMCLLLIISMSACGTSDDIKETMPTESTSAPTASTEQTIPETETIPSETSPSIEDLYDIPQFEYKMAGIHKEIYDEQSGQLFVAIEVKAIGWLISGSSFSVYNKHTGEELEFEPIYYAGNVCATNHRTDWYGDTLGQVNDYEQYTVCVDLEKENLNLNFEDLKVVANICWMSPEYTKTEYVAQDFEVNGTMADITTTQTYLHGYTLFAVGDSYYILDTQSGSTRSNETGFFRKLEVYPIKGTIETLFNAVSQNYGLAYTTSEHKNEYLHDAELPDGWELFIEMDANENAIYFGIKAGNDDSGKEEFIDCATLKTQIENGQWTYFLFAEDSWK